MLIKFQKREEAFIQIKYCSSIEHGSRVNNITKKLFYNCSWNNIMRVVLSRMEEEGSFIKHIFKQLNQNLSVQNEQLLKKMAMHKYL